MSYETIDYLRDLTASEMYSAQHLRFTPYTSISGTSNWDNIAEAYGSDNYACLHAIYSFNATYGATYDIFSASYFDPYLLKIYDDQGNTIVANNEEDDGANVLLLDGGYYRLDVIWDWVAPYSGMFYVDASWNQGNYYDFYSIRLLEDVDTVPQILIGTNGDDIIYSSNGDDIIDGGDGIDTVIFIGTHANHTIIKNVTGWNVSSTTNGFDTLSDIERLQFSDKTIALDIDGNAGQAYRIYQAAFDRTPDNNGLKYWISIMDAGNSLETVAGGFINSNEFSTLYGSNPTNQEFVSKLYYNVLHRAPDQEGYDYWVNLLDTCEINTAQTLVNFSESSENQVNVIGVIEYGIELF